ncbi:DNA-binding NarL/FixJ family response regulator [Mycobacterium sp. BK558]|nr:DNA-binding NarL/FixJ family response regulator [Mycobacterium sp. BK558]
MTASFPNGDRRAAARGNVLVVDDCALYREALKSALIAKGVSPVRTAWDLPSLIGALESLPPQVILLNMTTIGVQTFLRATASLSPEVPVVAVGISEEDEDTIFACAEARVAAYHTRVESLADLLVLINVVVKGKISYPPQISAILLGRMSAVAGRRRRSTKEPVLTSREIQILRLLELGRSNQAISDELSIAVHTVKNHVHSLLTKLGVSTRAEAAALSHSLHLDRKAWQRPESRSSRNSL